MERYVTTTYRLHEVHMCVHGGYVIGCDGKHTEQTVTFKVTLCIKSCNRYCKLVDTVNLDLYYCTSQLKKVGLSIN